MIECFYKKLLGPNACGDGSRGFGRTPRRFNVWRAHRVNCTEDMTPGFAMQTIGSEGESSASKPKLRHFSGKWGKEKASQKQHISLQASLVPHNIS